MRPAQNPSEGRLLVDTLALLGLSAFVFAQPVFDLLGRHPEFFVVRGSQAADLWLFVLASVFLIPGLLWLARLAAGLLGARAAAVGQAVAVGLLVTLLALQVLRQVGSEGWWLPVAPLVGVGAAMLYLARSGFRLFVSLLAVAALVLPAAFLLQPEMRRLLRGSGPAIALETSGAETPILFVLLDEVGLPSLLDQEGAIDARRFPNLAALASTATWYSDAAAVSDDTVTAVPALLTGKYPRPGQLPSSDDHPRSLFTLFGGDYAIYAEEALTRLCPPEVNRLGTALPPLSARVGSLASDSAVVWLHLTLPRSLAQRLPPIDEGWGGFLSAATAAAPGAVGVRRFSREEARHHQGLGAFVAREEQLADLLGAMGPQRQALYFYHLLYPHVPWEHLPSGRRYLRPRDPARPVAGAWPDSQETVRQAYRRYLLQMIYTDRVLGLFFDRLRELDHFDGALIVVTADHGASFRPGSPRRTHTPETVAEIAAVPLLIKAPFQRQAEIVTTPVSLVDVLPTMLDLLGMASPAGLDGVAAGAGRSPHARYFFTRHGERLSLPALAPEARAAAQRLDALVGSQLRTAELLKWGPKPELLGRPIAELSWRQRDDLRVRLDRAERYEVVHHGAPALPLLVTGTLEPVQDSDCCTLAVAVAGAVRATARTLTGPGGRHRFAILLPEEALEEGSNLVEVLVVGEAAGRVVLERPKQHHEPEYSLVQGVAGTTTALVVDGVRYPLGGEVRGELDGIRHLGEEVQISGWAVDSVAQAPAAEVVLFYDGRPVGSATPSRADERLARALGDPALTESRFDIGWPADRLPSLGVKGVQAFALSSRGTATELASSYVELVRGRDGRESLLAANGRLVPMSAGALAHSIDQIRRDGEDLLIAGWAEDADQRAAGDFVVLLEGRAFAQRGSVLAHAGQPGRWDPPVAASPRFTLRLPAVAEEALVRDAIRIIAVSQEGSSATELSLDRAPRPRSSP